jgi:hypothetical protein
MLVTVANFTEPWEAHMLRTRLQAEGILAFVAHDQHVANDWGIATGLGGAKVQVPSENAEAARAVEREAIAGRYRAELDAAFAQETERCPQCGAGDFAVRPRLRHSWFAVFVYLTTLGYAAPPSVPAAMRQCPKCRTRWPRRLAE